MALTQKRKRGSLSRKEIAATALRLMDEHGLESVTMRQLAGELDVGVMSLYIHAANKEEIITAAAELVLTGMPRASGKAKPRNAVIRYFEGFRRELVAHPSVAQAIASTYLAGPAVFASMDSLFAALARAGIYDESAVDAVTGLMSYTLGFVFFSTARSRHDPGAAAARASNLRGVDPDAFPHLHRVREQLVGDAFDRQFSTGLCLLVDAYLADAE